MHSSHQENRASWLPCRTLMTECRLQIKWHIDYYNTSISVTQFNSLTCLLANKSHARLPYHDGFYRKKWRKIENIHIKNIEYTKTQKCPSDAQNTECKLQNWRNKRKIRTIKSRKLTTCECMQKWNGVINYENWRFCYHMHSMITNLCVQ